MRSAPIGARTRNEGTAPPNERRLRFDPGLTEGETRSTADDALLHSLRAPRTLAPTSTVHPLTPLPSHP